MAGLARTLEKKVKCALWGAVGLAFSSFRGRAGDPQLPIDFAALRSVLVLRPDRLGDVVLSTPVYESIKRSFPELRVTALVDRACASLLDDNPHIDEILALDRRRPWTLFRQLWRKNFDVVFGLNKKFSATVALLALACGAKYRVGYAHDETSWLYNLRVPVEGPPRHEILNNLELLRAAGMTRVAQQPRLYFNAKEESAIESLLGEARRFPGRPRVLVKPGTRIAEWGWPLEKFRTVAERLAASGQAEVCFICGPGEEAMVDALAQGTRPPVRRLPVLSLKELALAIQKSSLLLCNHTGIMHLASAVNTPAVVIFKHGEIARWGPVHNRHAVLEERQGNHLTPETVLENIERLLHKE